MLLAAKIKKRIKGFTLIELLVVIGILAILFAIVLIAINPVEQFNKTADVATQAVTRDLASTVKYFYTQKKTTIWENDQSCRDELTNQSTIDMMPDCIRQLTLDPELESKVVNSSEAKDINMTQCNDSLAVCFKARSSAFKNDPQAKYDKNGAVKQGCPGGDNCYICNFTTNEGQECFTALSPNSTVGTTVSNDSTVLLPIPSRNSIDVCDKPTTGTASCAGKVVASAAGEALSSLAPPAGFGPEQLHKAYSLPCNRGGIVDWQCATPSTWGPTIAVVIAYHTPTMERDLTEYSDRYGIPRCTIANGCLTIVNQDGQTSPVPGQNSSWSLEATLDMQVTHAICQTCKLLLVEARDNSFANLALAVNRAVTMGAVAINNSYAGLEYAGTSSYPGTSSYDPYYDHPGIYVTSATGDWGPGSYYPAASKHVIAVGGTTLSLYGNSTYAGETTWSQTGGACSPFQDAYSFQTSLPNWNAVGCGTKRATADVAAVADPNTGVAIYTTYNGITGWWIVGGTSASSPIVNAALVLRGNAPSGVDAATSIYADPSKYRDVTAGSNGSCSGSPICTAGVGYDGPTGLGSPNFFPELFPTTTQEAGSTPSPTPTPMESLSSSDPAYGYVVDSTYHVVTKVTRLGTSLSNICQEGEKLYCYGSFKLSQSDMTANHCRDDRGNSRAVYTNVSCDTNFTDIPWPTPTPAYPNCSQQHTISLKDSSPILATPGSSATTTLLLKNNNTGNCNPVTYYVSSVYPGNTNPDTWSATGNYGPFLVGTGETKEIVYTINVPSVGLFNKDYSFKTSVAGVAPTEYTQWWVKSTGLLNSVIRVSGATPAPTPTSSIPAECLTQPTATLSQPLVSGLPGAKLSNRLTIKSNNPPNCNPTYYTISYGIPTGWGLIGTDSYYTLIPGATKNIDFTLYFPSDGLLTQDYNYQFWVTTSGQNSVNPVVVNGIARVSLDSTTISPTPSPIPTTTPSPLPSPTATPTPTQNCTTQQTVTLTQDQPILALPGDTVLNSLTVKNNDSPSCPSLLYTVSQGYTTGWTLNGIPPSFTLAAGATKTINFSINVPFTAMAGNYGYQFWVAKQGQTSSNPVNGSVQVEQVGPTYTPTPTPINCFQGWTNSLGSTSLSGNAGDTINETLTITYNNPPSCGSTTFGISYGYPTGWIINGLMPPSVKLTGGQTVTIPITITISTGAQIQDYLLQFWVNNGSNNMNATVHVLSTAPAPTQQMFSNFNPKMYGTYALFEYSDDVTGALATRLDVATDPSALNQTSNPPSTARYNFASSYGGAMDATNMPIPTSVRGFIVSSPQTWSGWQCGATIYYRIYDSGDLRVKSDIQSGVVDCTTVIDVLPWSPWYAAIYQGVYDSRYDVDQNGIIDYNDYWSLVRATRLR